MTTTAHSLRNKRVAMHPGTPSKPTGTGEYSLLRWMVQQTNHLAASHFQLVVAVTVYPHTRHPILHDTPMIPDGRINDTERQ